MTDPSATEPPTDVASAETPSTPSTAPTQDDHHGLLTFLAVLALLLLLVGAVGASTLGGPRGSGQSDEQGQGNAFGQQKRAEKQQQRAERQAEKREQQRQRKERQRALKEQRRQSGVVEPQTEPLTEQTGTVAVRTSADGTTAYVLETATGVLVLDVGPARYWGDNHPLVPLVGTSVTVMGVQEAGSDQFSVFVIGDQVIRGPGRPPWAGGSKQDSPKAPTNEPTPAASPSTGPSPSP
ncbi:MAG: hypothetical protein ABWY52_01025 [Candidatus Limnocylindrales bacterium]